MRLSFLLFASLLLPAAPAMAQLAPGYLVSVTQSIAILASDSGPDTLVATVAPTNNAPISSLDGTMVKFGQMLVPVKNGTASIQIPFPGPLGTAYQLEVDYPANYNPIAGGSYKIVDIATRIQPLFTAFSGDYVLSVHSYSGAGTAPGGEGVSIGVLRINNESATFTGELDYNGPLGNFQALPVTGTYTVDGNGVAGFVVQSSAGTQHFDVSIQTSQLNFTGRITQASLIETDTPRVTGSGNLYARGVFTPPAQAAPPLKTDLGGVLLQLTGQASFGGPYPVPVSITQNSAPSPLPNTVDLVAGSYVQRSVPATVNDTSSPDAFGRFTFTVAVQNQPAQQPTNYAAYGIDDARVLLLSTDPVTSYALLSGEADVPVSQQQ